MYPLNVSVCGYGHDGIAFVPALFGLANDLPLICIIILSSDGQSGGRSVWVGDFVHGDSAVWFAKWVVCVILCTKYRVSWCGICCGRNLCADCSVKIVLKQGE